MSSSSPSSSTRGYVFAMASLCVAVCSRWAVVVDAFNVDTSNPLIFQHSDTGSQFGLALTLHREGGQNMLLVGAPRAVSSGYSPDMGIGRSGALFKCPIDTSTSVTDADSECQEIVVDTTGNEYLTEDPNFQSTNATGQWLGSVVQSGGSDGSVVVCRPLYQYQALDNSEKIDRFLEGGCFVINGGLTSPNLGLLDTVENYNPCAAKDDVVGYRKRYRCEFGGSAAVRDARIVYGAPGACLWKGRFWYTAGTIDDSSPQYSYPQGACAFKLDFEYYFGHALAFGNFRDGPSSALEVAVGAPRWKHGFARVFLYDDSQMEYDQLYASDLATYFGHALAASDLNNDGYDDLVVSAPMFTDEERSIDAGWEVGKIFIYYNDQQGSFSIDNVDTIIGTGAGCRFGYSLAALGDINGDGFNDLAVGAPFCEGGDVGKVFIYHGTGINLPLNLSPQQILNPPEQGTPLKYFGFVISAGYDIDQNDYPDFAVGAHESQTALIYRSRAVVSTSADIYVEENPINLDFKNMTTSNGISVAGFRVVICIQYSGQGVPDNLNFIYDILLDSSRQLINRRAAFISNNMASLNGQTLSASLEGRTCATHDAYIRPAIRDKQTPITLQLTHGLDEAAQSSSTVQPIMSNRATTVSINSLVFARDCAGETCYPDLGLNTNVSTTQLMIGKAETFLVTVDVMNSGEDAFLSVLEIFEPPGLFFVSVQRSNTGTIVSCSSSSTTNKRTCNIGNPLGAGDEITVKLQYQTATYSSFSGPAVLNLTARSTDAEKPGRDEDNFASVSIPVFASSSLVLTGNSIPDTLVIIEDSNETDSIGPPMSHVIRLQNNGPSFIGPSIIEILWPIRLQDGTVLMTVAEASTETGMPCTSTLKINSGASTENNITTYEDDVSNTTIYTLWADCDSLPECLVIQCPLSSLGVGADAAVIISVESMLLRDTVFAKYFLHYIEVVSTASVSVNGTVYPGIPYSPHPTVSPLEIQTEIRVQYEKQRVFIQTTPIWIYIVSSIGGLLILIIVIAILYKVKFFKRKQITEEQREILQEHRKSVRRSRMSAPDPDSPPPDDALGMEESPLQREGSVAGLIQE
ncbi:integrin alpha-V-like [Lytechinus variegatus]|uniref:integrin alpha-V-like n=1 Tax=Lytechinus variegatus TaxID=7654 RepID=UPI001BB213EA|nr:integrin alpha-V-like [Lytechinus variegatus]